MQVTVKAAKKSSGIWLPVIIGGGLLLLVGLAIFAIRYMRGSSSTTAYYDTTPYTPMPQATGQNPANMPANPQESPHEYPW